MSQMPSKVQEIKLLAPVTVRQLEKTKFETWCDYYFDKSNKDTYYNATKSALKVYNTTKINSAAVIGHGNLRKVKNSLRIHADSRGITPALLFDTAVKKLATNNNPEWMKIVFRLMGEGALLEDTQKLELTGKDGAPLQMQVLAGIGFIPKEANDTKVSKPREDDAAPIGSVVER